MKCNLKLREVNEIGKICVRDYYFGCLFILFIILVRVSICFEYFVVIIVNVIILFVVFIIYYRFLGVRGRFLMVDRNRV